MEVVVPDGSMSNSGITVKSLGNTVTYSPDQLFEKLRATHAVHLAHLNITDREKNIRVIMHLYSLQSHSIDPVIAGGIVDLVYVGKHVSAIVLNAYLADD